MLYERPVSALMEDAAEAMTDRFGPADVIAWFRDNYPDVKDTTVRAHVIGLTANDPSRRHYQWLVGKPPLFFKIGPGNLERFDPARHLETELPGVDSESDTELVEVPTDEQRMEFFLEAYLEEFLLSNWHLIDWGRRLEIWEANDGRTGHQLSTPVGRLDFLCRDVETNALVVVELKRGLPSDRVVGQTARYMGWVRAELAAVHEVVEGVIVAHEADERLRYAVAAVPGMSLLLYEVRFALRDGAL